MNNNKPTILYPHATALEIANQEAVSRLLNTYLREVIQDTSHSIIGLTGSLFRIYLKYSKRFLMGQLSYYSLFGHHHYEFPLYVEEAQGLQRKLHYQDIIDYLIVELEMISQKMCKHVFIPQYAREQIQNSIMKTEKYIEKQLNTESSLKTYIRSEQAIICGHPFHPTPKSTEGFSEADLQRYAPEMKTTFQLVYWAVHKDLTERIDLSGDQNMLDKALPKEIREYAERYLGERSEQYELLPVHPWQDSYLSNNSKFLKLMKEKGIISLGPLGPEVFPTSSVRTVWSPWMRCFLKLPIHVKITHFVRTNSKEQVDRTMDAARIIHVIKDHVQHNSIRILNEFGYLSIKIPELFDEIAVVYRENPTDLIVYQEEWIVAAALLERPLDDHSYNNFSERFVDHRGHAIASTNWLEFYVRIFLIPVLKLFANWGISLEAHVQNVVVRIQNGIPVQCYVRDLEGISVAREVAERRGWIGNVIREGSPVLYSYDEAFNRLLYYVFTNHLGHLIATLSQYGLTSEAVLWSTVGKELEEAKEHSGPAFSMLVDSILETSHLSAKANLLSWVQGTGEKPQYTKIINPLFKGKVKQS